MTCCPTNSKVFLTIGSWKILFPLLGRPFANSARMNSTHLGLSSGIISFKMSSKFSRLAKCSHSTINLPIILVFIKLIQMICFYFSLRNNRGIEWWWLFSPPNVHDKICVLKCTVLMYSNNGKQENYVVVTYMIVNEGSGGVIVGDTKIKDTHPSLLGRLAISYSYVYPQPIVFSI